ncbi:type III-A CRISPR-associated RAMP protein Csm4 [Thermococcus sp. LS2]|uniref:type III-A CRISPR-associated RAMP protein Csm4 n=1 Tax=Thermococcus sp. LS2 TaxID=1638260 RepID=UPI001439D522|nr:type III-A CRISPR-associated RAMP protein Csm4 [Thermococcus sp. LS2]NJE13347.1 type III-A CRISPR-associated RAMP protein Csm4 [Thermococcus sp. LS2]
MQAKAVKLHFKSPLHVGSESGLSEAVIPVHSDTIFGAIVNALVYLDLDIWPFIRAFERGEFSISSAFPFKGEKLYFPKPLNANELLKNLSIKSQKDYSNLKKFKRKKFFDKDSFEKLINGELPNFDEIDFEESYGYKISDIPKVALDRITADSQIYYISQVFFEDNAGLYFLFQGNEEIFKRYIKPAIKLLGDEGIGGKRTWGLGIFKPKFEDIKLKTPESDKFVTLSLMIPKSKDNLILWSFVRRSGWVFTRDGKPRRKPTMMMVGEGSIVKNDPGKLIDLDEYGNFSADVEHKVLVNARSFLIPVRWEHET